MDPVSQSKEPSVVCEMLLGGTWTIKKEKSNGHVCLFYKLR